MVAEVDSKFSLTFGWLSAVQQSLEFDLSALQIKPIFAQFTVPETRDEYIADAREEGKLSCFGVY